MTDQSPLPENPGAGERKYWLDSRANVDKIYWGLVVICAALFLGDALYQKHPEFSFEKTFGFYALFGFGAFVFIVFVAKGLRKILKRGEEFYADPEDGS
jgi:hypothetical protein